ncbi:hypothetical protein N7510_000752 [Penicillium lagena]|uniref:uncharacterized protein n=1 Tax=Penicillium lagena TaxID=94218 RepID=UPI00253F668F|nr:uncharacterized protein N7510_000752 [Penicillium lagena]KAJ5624443.1 hypothetical protein N7510_000752 [Penicillium lagena]
MLGDVSFSRVDRRLVRIYPVPSLPSPAKKKLSKQKTTHPWKTVEDRTNRLLTGPRLHCDPRAHLWPAIAVTSGSSIKASPDRDLCSFRHPHQYHTQPPMASSRDQPRPSDVPSTLAPAVAFATPTPSHPPSSSSDAATAPPPHQHRLSGQPSSGIMPFI